jgi:autotransporter translocation and assembly factor TamB
LSSAPNSTGRSAGVARRVLRWVRATAAVALLVAAMAAGVWVWLGTQSSANTLAFLVNRWAPGVHVGMVTGSVRHGAHLDAISWRDGESSATITDLEWTAQIQASWSDVIAALVKPSVDAGGETPTAAPLVNLTLNMTRVSVVLGPSSQPERPPLVLPSAVNLPLALDVRLGVKTLEITQDQRVHRLDKLRVRYRHAAGHQPHVFDLDELHYGDLQATAHASVRSVDRWPLAARLQIETPATVVAAHLSGQRLSAWVTLEGHLAAAQVDGKTEQASLVLSAQAHRNQRLLLDAQATINPWAPQPLERASAALSQVDIAAWLPAGSGVPATNISGSLQVAPGTGGAWLADVSLTQAPTALLPAAKLDAHAVLSDQRLEVSGIDFSVKQASTAQAWLRGSASMDTGAAQLRANLQGGAPGLQLTTDFTAGTQLQQLPVGHVALTIDNAAALTRWFNQLAQRTQLADPIDVAPTGRVRLDASFSDQGQVDATLIAEQLAVPLEGASVTLSSATVRLSNTWQDLQVSLDAQVRAPVWLERADIQATTRLTIPAKPAHPLTWQDLRWRASVTDLAKRTWQASTTSGWTGQLHNGKATGNASGLSVGLQGCAAPHCAALLSWQPWSASGQGIDFAGHIANINAALAQAIAPQAPSTADSNWRSDLVLGGPFQVQLGPNTPPNVFLRLSKTGGDVEVAAPSAKAKAWRSLALQTLALQVDWMGRRLQAQAQIESGLAGSAVAQLSTTLDAAGWGLLATPNAPLTGTGKLQLKDLAWLSPWLPANLQVGGTLQAQLSLGGTHAKPVPGGVIEAQHLFARDKYGDFDVGGGALKAQLDEQGITVQNLVLHGVVDEAQGGALSATGRLNWADNAGDAAQLKLKLERFQVASKADRRVRISGELNSRWVNGRLSVKGGLGVDKADITLSKLGAPRLGEDVVIVGNKPAPPSQALPLDLDIDLSLGDAFKVTGFGLTTGLRGKLHISGPDANNQPILYGEVNTVDARYKAYGQDLSVKRGRLVFAGRPDAPQLDILAVRTLTEPQVGVQVQGALNAPKVQLYASVPMADSEKLSWLLLGHPSARGGSEAALIQSAVLALVGDTNALVGGVDEFSIDGETKLSDGTIRAAQFTVGKQLGDRLYTTYTRSVASIQGLLSVYLKLTDHLAVRAQTGESNNIDLVWTRAYD